MDVKSYYDTYWSDGGFQPVGGDLTPQLRSLLRRFVQSGARCLDVGCGDGRTVGPWLVEHGCRYVGVDVSETAVHQAAAVGLDARVIEDATVLPFDDASFDVGLMVEVLEHLFAPHEAVAELHRVLRPGGVLLVTVPNVCYWRRRVDLALFGRWNPFGDDLSVEQPWRDPHVRFFTLRSMARMLRQAGFVSVATEGHGGAILRDLPLVRRLDRGHPSQAYVAAERLFPSILGLRVGAVAIKA
jgi:methionine biosynthesis protein MetW